MCTHCNDTGSLSKDLDSFFDCVHCGIAEERAALESWADERNVECYSADLWLIYQHGRAAAGATGSAA
jgi:hypothetical protein